MTAVLRAHSALKAAGLTNAGRMVKATNSNNEVWFVGPYVMRINAHPEQPRLLHERTVLQALPRGLPVPTLVGYGQETFGEWMVVTRAPGEELSRHWTTMSDRQRSDAILTLGVALRELHRVKPADPALTHPWFSEGDTLDCPQQLPAERLFELLARAARLRHVDRFVIADAIELVAGAASALDDHPTTLVHGDLHFENVLWDGSSLTAIIDFEWARVGSPDLDLDVLLHSLADPAAHHGVDYVAPQRKDFENVTALLRDAYPEILSHPRLAERLLVYRLSYDTRALLQQPPDRPSDLLSPRHPYRRLQRVVEGRSDLSWVLAG
jgi:hygromycin-B 7''-O-kinase